MKMGKMNGFGNRVKNCIRFKTFSAQEMKKRALRNRILEIQETLVYMKPLRGYVCNNHWLEAIMEYSRLKEDRLLRKYVKRYGEFPVTLAEEEMKA